MVGKRESEVNSVAIRQLGSNSQEILALKDAIRKLKLEVRPPHKRDGAGVDIKTQDRVQVTINN